MLCDFCVQTPEIMAFYHMVGNFNVLLRFAVPDVKTLDALVSKIRTFGDSRTSIELQTVFEKVDPTNRTVVSPIFALLQLSRAPRTASPALRCRPYLDNLPRPLYTDNRRKPNLAAFR